MRRLFTRPDVDVTGYGEDGRVEVPPDAPFTIGRTGDAEVSIHAEIGGHRTYVMYWRAPDWVFKVNHEWAIALIDGERIPGHFESRPVRHGSVIEVHQIHDGGVIHRFRVEFG